MVENTENAKTGMFIAHIIEANEKFAFDIWWLCKRKTNHNFIPD